MKQIARTRKETDLRCAHPRVVGVCMRLPILCGGGWSVGACKLGACSHLRVTRLLAKGNHKFLACTPVGCLLSRQNLANDLDRPGRSFGLRSLPLILASGRIATTPKGAATTVHVLYLCLVHPLTTLPFLTVICRLILPSDPRALIGCPILSYMLRLLEHFDPVGDTTHGCRREMGTTPDSAWGRLIGRGSWKAVDSGRCLLLSPLESSRVLSRKTRAFDSVMHVLNRPAVRSLGQKKKNDRIEHYAG